MTYAKFFMLGWIMAFAAWFLRCRLSPQVKTRVVVKGFIVFNSLLVVVPIALLLIARPAYGQAESQQKNQQVDQNQQEQSPRGIGTAAAIGAALSTGLAAIGAGIAVASTGSAAIGSITEKPETLGMTLIYVGLAEGIAIYGLIISFMILTGGFGG